MTSFWRRATTRTPTDVEVRSKFEQRGTQCQVFLSGRITIDSSPALRELLLQRVQSPGCQSLTADFDEVVYVDTSGVATLVEVLKSARANGKTFYLTRLRERPRYLLEATRLLHLFDEVNSSEVSR